MLNLDTHILVFALLGDLRPREKQLLSNSTWSISSVVLWELAKLVELSRLSIDRGDRTVQRTLAAIHTWQIDLNTARTSTVLDVKGDPADQLIAATSVVQQVPLLTRDRQLQRSKLVPLAT